VRLRAVVGCFRRLTFAGFWWRIFMATPSAAPALA
jgi:hypothetical protein